MDEFYQVVDWFFSSIQRIYNFFVNQHPIVQMRVFLPMALLVVGLFISFIKGNERSI